MLTKHMGELAWADPILGVVYVPTWDGKIHIDFDVGEPCACSYCAWRGQYVRLREQVRADLHV